MTDPARLETNRLAREERKRAYLRTLMDRHAAGFRAPGERDAQAVAREAHATLDAILERDLRREPARPAIQCSRGCSHCCHGPVEIWPHEAALLVAAARADGLELDRARLARQARQSLDTWREQPPADTACAFLGADGACRVYEARPNACRKLLVVSRPELCDRGRYPPESVERWMSWEAEMLETAAQEVLGRALLPHAVLDELER
jgi:Fe-S-cluster containining protein